MKRNDEILLPNLKPKTREPTQDNQSDSKTISNCKRTHTHHSPTAVRRSCGPILLSLQWLAWTVKKNCSNFRPTNAEPNYFDFMVWQLTQEPIQKPAVCSGDPQKCKGKMQKIRPLWTETNRNSVWCRLFSLSYRCHIYAPKGCFPFVYLSFLSVFFLNFTATEVKRWAL